MIADLIAAGIVLLIVTVAVLAVVSLLAVTVYLTRMDR